MGAARFQQDWVNDLLAVGEAIEMLGPIRADFCLKHGFILDGRYGVSPLEVVKTAQAYSEARLRRKVS